MAKPPQNEAAVVKACLHWLTLNRCFVWRNNSGAYAPEKGGRFVRFGKKGSADIIGLNPHGVFLAVECKAGKNKLQPAQIAFRDSVVACGGVHVVAYSVDDLEAAKADIMAKRIAPAYAEGVEPQLNIRQHLHSIFPGSRGGRKGGD